MGIDSIDIARQGVSRSDGVAAPSGYVPTADGLGGIDWLQQAADVPQTLSLGTVDATTVVIELSGGGSATVPSATPVAAGLMSAADFLQLQRARVYLVDMIYWSNATRSGVHTTDGYTCADGDIVACVGSGAQNGIYQVNAGGAWTRVPWYSTDADIRGSWIVAKANGSSSSGNTVQCTNAAAITVDTTSITYSVPFCFGIATAGQLSINRYGTASALSLAFYANGGTSATTGVNRATGANGNFDITNTGTGTYRLVTNGVAVLHHPGNNTGTATLFEAHTTGSVQIGQALTSGTVTVGNASGTGTHVIQSTGAAAPLALRGSQAATVIGLDLRNINAATTAAKAVALLFSGDATPFTGGRILTTSSQPAAWNSASQLMEMVFAVGVGTTLTDSVKIAQRGLLAPLRGLSRNYRRVSAATDTVNASGVDNVILFEVGACTVTFPASTAITDGQELVLVNNHSGAVSLTLTAGSGTTVANASEALQVGYCAEYKYIAALTKWVRVNAVSGTGNVIKLAEDTFASAANRNISIPSGYRYYKLLCRNMTHDHTAGSRLRLRFFNGVTQQNLRQYSTSVTELLANATYGVTLNGQNADLELDCDFHGTYRRGVHAKYTTHTSATGTNYPQSAPLSATQDYATRLESSLVCDVLQISWTLGNIAATGDWALYGYN